jgi:hypothetical protein
MHVAVVHDVVVLQRGDIVVRSTSAADEVTARSLVEGSVRAGEGPGVADRYSITDSRFDQSTPPPAGGAARPSAGVEVPVDGHGRRRAVEHERQDTIGEVEGQDLRDAPAGGDADSRVPTGMA